MPTTAAARLPGPQADRRVIPGIGPETRGRIPADARQVLVASGDGVDSDTAEVVLYTRAGDARWRAGQRWPAHNAARGWTTDHRLGDLRSPQGVFELSDAGGKRPAPGAKLPYQRSHLFTVTGAGVEGEPLAGAFDYVVAIDYNRVAGNSPLDQQRPDGAAKGGGVWLHVDHDGPTQGCVSLSRDAMRALLGTLDPGMRPVIVMGPKDWLAR
ncbi:L,D-transpeptidase family protein [Streptomyces sp. H27-D2]|nr:L,D-transpeptidase family protein [Streptomyces sp. H27-D2]MEC4019774.1 L,D-transpeptidase family protein [Streptomyces sp. H27-D2]